MSIGGGVGVSPPVSGTVSYTNATMRNRIRFRDFVPERKRNRTSGAIMAAFILAMPMKEISVVGRGFAAITAVINGQRWEQYWEYISHW